MSAFSTRSHILKLENAWESQYNYDLIEIKDVSGNFMCHLIHLFEEQILSKVATTDKRKSGSPEHFLRSPDRSNLRNPTVLKKNNFNLKYIEKI